MIKIFCLLLLCLAGLATTVNAQIKQPEGEPFDSPDTPITCEMWILYVSDAVQRWGKNKNSSLIVIVRLGNKENSRQMNMKRIKTLKDYILVPRWKVKAVFAEGERIKGFGTIEFYIEGKLLYSLPVKEKENIPLEDCNP